MGYWDNMGEQYYANSVNGAAVQQTERIMGSIAQVQQQSGNTAGALDALLRMFIFRTQNQR